MTAAAIDPAAAIAVAGQELLDKLRELVDRSSTDDVPSLLDELSGLLRRARGRVNRAVKKATEAAAPKPPAEPAKPAPAPTAAESRTVPAPRAAQQPGTPPAPPKAPVAEPCPVAEQRAQACPTPPRKDKMTATIAPEPDSPGGRHRRRARLPLTLREHFMITLCAAVLAALAYLVLAFLNGSASQRSADTPSTGGPAGSGIEPILTTPATTVQIAPPTTATAVITTTTTPQATATAAPKPAAPVKTAVPASWDSIFQRTSAAFPAPWTVKDLGAWGRTDLNTGVIYIAPRTPSSYLKAVMLHEWIHHQQWGVYGSKAAAVEGLAPYGGIEAVADCGARQLGARWTHYVQSCTAEMNHAAAAMRNGVRP